MSGNHTGKTAAAMTVDEAAARDMQPVITRCVLCPGWQHEGTALEGREAHKVHKRTHPKTGKPKRPRRTPAGVYVFEKRTTGTKAERHAVSAKRQADHKQDHVTVHGTLTGYYSKACRCDLCKKAGADYYQKRKARRAA